MIFRIGRKAVLGGFGIGLAALLVGPFLVPVPPLEGLQPPEALADPASLFVELNRVKVHYKTLGQGEPAFILLHGFAASLYSWDPIMEPLSQYGRVIAYDRTGFGLTERPMRWEGQNPYSAQAQVDLLIALLDYFGIQRAILVGNSAGGTVAMQAALAHPGRVAALILVDAAVYNGGGPPHWITPLLATPQARHLGPLVSRQLLRYGPRLVDMAWHDPTLLSPEMLVNYQKPYQVENWDKALWEVTLASRPNGLVDRLGGFSLPILVVSGDDDRIVPTADSIRLAEALPNARLAVIENAGHIPHEEQPQQFIQAVAQFLDSSEQ